MGFYWQLWRFPYERSIWITDHEQARRWYKALELAGVEPVRDQVRAALARGAGPPGGIPIWTEQSVTIGFCQEWLSWHDRRKRRRQIFLAVVGIVVPVLLAIVGWYLAKRFLGLHSLAGAQIRYGCETHMRNRLLAKQMGLWPVVVFLTCP